jgi:SAM-dependent methyltransferase
VPFPAPAEGPDLIYARFLLAHLPDSARALRGWCEALRPGGRLLLDEVESIESGSPVFTRYLALVEETLASRRQCLTVGARLDALAGDAGVPVVSSQVREHPVDPRDAARMYALNLETLRPDDVELRDALLRTAAGGGPPITWRLRQGVVGSAA